MSNNVVDEVNQATMRSKATVAYYGTQDELTPNEIAVLKAAEAAISQGPVLDLGVGGGRTTGHLLALNRDYRGIDYAEEMVERCRARFPGVAFERGDARELSSVADASCGFVFFSCNGIGMVDFPGRRRILQEVARVLRPGGFFAFSFHNQDQVPAADDFRLPHWELSFNPARALVRTTRFARRVATRWRNRRRLLPLEQRTAEYALINDPCQDYGTMLCYVTLANQLRHLEEAGFAGPFRVFALDGHELGASEIPTDDSLTVLARK